MDKQINSTSREKKPLEAKFPLTSNSAERSRKDVMLWNL